MLEIYNANSKIAANKRVPEEIYNGDGVTQSYALLYITPDILARVFVEQELKGTNTDFYTYYFDVYNYVFFYNIPPLGTSNVIFQSDTCLWVPGGTVNEGYCNAYYGEEIDLCYYVATTAEGESYEDLTCTPVEHIGSDGIISLVKLALTQEGLDSAAAGEPLTIGTVTDALTPLWVRVTIPSNYLGPYVPYLNIYDLGFMFSGTEVGGG